MSRAVKFAQDLRGRLGDGYDVTVTPVPVAVSYSGGASSEWMIQAVIEGLIPRPDIFLVVFADTGSEHSWTYERVSMVEDRCERHGIPFIRCWRTHTDGTRDVLADTLLTIPTLPNDSRLDHPPFAMATGGRAQHRCTREYKVAPMRRAISTWLSEQGLPKRIVKWIGFGHDERHRATKAVAKLDVRWERLDFPAIRLGRTRAHQRDELARWIGSAPPFSMCTICPFKSPKRWLETPVPELQHAYKVDEAIRDCSAIGLDHDAYLTDRVIPLRQLIERGDPQLTLPGLESYCDGGACFL